MTGSDMYAMKRRAAKLEGNLSGWCFQGRPLEDHRMCPRKAKGGVCQCTKQGCPCAAANTPADQAGESQKPVVGADGKLTESVTPGPQGLQILEDLIHGSEEWHDARRGIMTASTVGQLITWRSLTAIEFECPDCGARPYDACTSKRDSKPISTLHPARATAAKDDDSPPILEPARNDYSRSLTLTLVAERLTGFTDPTWISGDMYRGIEDEPRAVAVYSENYAPVRTIGFMVRHFEGFRLGYSPDGLVGEDGLIEIKSRRQKKQLQTVLADEVPAENMAQLQAGLLVSGRQWVDYISYCGGMPMYVKRVTPDPRWFDAILAAVTEFERTANEMTAAYNQAIKGLPLTERAAEYGEITV